jgi:hypothetical protein
MHPPRGIPFPVTSERRGFAPLSILAAVVALLIASSSALALPVASLPPPAPTLFLTTGGNGNSTAAASNLWRLDPATGAATAIGNTGFAITGLAQDPTTGVLYGVSNARSPITPKTLLTINPSTGAATPIGPLGLIIADITFDSQGRLFGWSEEFDTLASIDKATGAATEIGVNELNTFGSGSAFDKGDNYWLFPEGEGEARTPNEHGDYYTIDVNTGKPSLRGKLTPIDPNESSISAAAYDCARTTLYATVSKFGEPPSNLVTIDTAAGSFSNKGVTQTGADGLEWFCPLAFEFANPKLDVAAKKQTLTVPLLRGPQIKGAASVDVATVAGSARAGRDFVAMSGTFGFANNVSDGSFSVTVKGDPKAGDNRSFEVALSSPSAGGTVGAPLQVTILAAKPKPAKIVGPSSTPAARVVFKLRSNQLPARFRCKLDEGKFRACGKNGRKAKKFKTRPLRPGRHKLVVQVVNGAGRKSKPAKKLFTVLP